MLSALLSHTALLLLRSGSFLGCRRYVHRSLLSDLRQVIRDDACEPIEDDLPAAAQAQLDGDPSWPNPDALKPGPSSLKPDPVRLRSPKRTPPGSASSSGLPASFTTFLFCWSFSEGSLLFSIVILGSWLDPEYVLCSRCPRSPALTRCPSVAPASSTGTFRLECSSPRWSTFFRWPNASFLHSQSSAGEVRTSPSDIQKPRMLG